MEAGLHEHETLGIARKLLQCKQLPNGLRLELWDESRKVAGDRWYVGVRAVAAVALPRETPEGISPEVLRILKREVGEYIYCQFLEERNFIAEQEVLTILDELKEVFLKNTLSYLSHPDFPRRFLIRKTREIQQKLPWGEDYVRKILDEVRFPRENLTSSPTDPGR